MLKTVSSITNAIGALNYVGTWNASTNTPTLASGVGTKGDYYQVSVAGSTALDGISNWGVGDVVAFNGTTWQRIEGGADLNGVNLSVSGTSTLSALTASTALALDASKNVIGVTNTGSGNNVLATSPTFSTDTTVSGTSGYTLKQVSQNLDLFLRYTVGSDEWTIGSAAGFAGAGNYLAFNQFTGGGWNNRARFDANGYYLIGYTTSNGAYNLQVNSQIFATSSTIATSDGRYKENVKDITGALDLVCSLQPKSFTWKTGEAAADGVRNPTFGKEITRIVPVEVKSEDGTASVENKEIRFIDNREWLREPHNFNSGTTVGFIAQDVQQALAGTEFVDSVIKRNTRPAAIDDAGNEVAPASEFLGIAEGNLISILAAAIKELKAELDAYKATHP